MPSASRYAAVTSTIALVIAMGGTGYAVSALPHNSVGTKQLKNNAVTSAKLKKNAVTSAKIKSNAITSSKVKNGSLTAADLKAGTIPSVPSSLLTPIAVFQMNSIKILNQVVRAPITGPISFTLNGTGKYEITLPGIANFNYQQYPTVCSSGNDAGDGVVTGSLGGKLQLQGFDGANAAKNVIVQCAVYLLPESS